MPRPRKQRVQALPEEDVYVVRLVEAGSEPVLVRKRVYLCPGCREVWALKHHAEQCASRDHVDTVEQDYYDKLSSRPTTYTYESIRYEPRTER